MTSPKIIFKDLHFWNTYFFEIPFFRSIFQWLINYNQPIKNILPQLFSSYIRCQRKVISYLKNLRKQFIICQPSPARSIRTKISLFFNIGHTLPCLILKERRMVGRNLILACFQKNTSQSTFYQLCLYKDLTKIAKNQKYSSDF